MSFYSDVNQVPLMLTQAALLEGGSPLHPLLVQVLLCRAQLPFSGFEGSFLAAPVLLVMKAHSHC